VLIGHFGVGLAAKKLDNKPSLGTLFFASQFIDLLWPILLLASLEKVKIDPGNTAFTPLDFVYYPFSHSLVGVLIWSALFGSIYFLIRRNAKSSMVLAALVMSHWILDLIVHRPDLPLLPWADLKVGLGLWSSVLFSILVEGSIFITGAYLYLRTTKAKNRAGQISLWSFLAFLTIIYVVNAFGPPPSSEMSIAVVGLFQWLFIAWGYWIDKNRMVVS
jgi:hypothetical protein